MRSLLVCVCTPLLRGEDAVGVGLFYSRSWGASSIGLAMEELQRRHEGTAFRKRHGVY